MSKVKTEMIAFPSNGETTPGYLARPQDEEVHPGLVVIQEWWGLVPHIKDVAQRFAAQGFIALAPDLYHGQAASEPDEARKLAMELEEARAVAEIQAAVHFLQGMQTVSPKKIGVVGWCMGGHLTLSTAAESRDLGAAVAFYGRPRDVNMAAQIEAPVLGLYAEHDHGIPLELVHQFDQALEQHGVAHEIRIYPGTGHAFFNDTRPQIYDPEAAQDTWQRTLDWFRRYLV